MQSGRSLRKIIIFAFKALVLSGVFLFALNFSFNTITEESKRQDFNPQRQDLVEVTAKSFSIFQKAQARWTYGDPTIVTKRLTDSNPRLWVNKVYSIARGFTNILLVVFLLVIAFANILHISINTYAIKSILPKIIVVAVFANLALPIIALFSRVLDNIGTIDIFNGGMSLNTGFPSGTVMGWLGMIVGLYLTSCCNTLLILLIPVMELGIQFFMAIRPYIVWIAAAVSPLAIACYALPQTEPYFKKWLKVLVFWMVYPLIVNALLYVYSLIQFSFDASTYQGGIFAVIFSRLIQLGLAYFILRMPFAWEKDIGGLISRIPGTAQKIGGAAIAKVVTTAGSVYSLHEMAAGVNKGERDIRGEFVQAQKIASGNFTPEESRARAQEKREFVTERMAQLRAQIAEHPNDPDNPREGQLSGIALREWHQKEREEKEAAMERLVEKRTTAIRDADPNLSKAQARQRAIRDANAYIGANSEEERLAYLQNLLPLTASMSRGEQYKAKGLYYVLGQALTQGKDGEISRNGRFLIRGLGTVVALTNMRANTGEVVANSAKKLSLKESYPWSVNPVTQAAYGRERAKGDLANADTPDAIRAANDKIFDAAWAHFCKLHGYNPKSAAAAVAYRKFIVEINTANSTFKTLGRPEYDEVRKIARDDQFTSPESQLLYVFDQQGKMVRTSGRRMTRDPDEANMAFANAMLPLVGGKAQFPSTPQEMRAMIGNGDYQRIIREGAPSGSPTKLTIDASGVEDVMRDMALTFKGYTETSSKSIAESIDGYRTAARGSDVNLTSHLRESDRWMVRALKNLVGDDLARRSATASPLEIENLLRAIRDLKDNDE